MYPLSLFDFEPPDVKFYVSLISTVSVPRALTHQAMREERPDVRAGAWV